MWLTLGLRAGQDGTGMHLYRDQMYVESLTPQGGVQHTTPIVFVHGQAQTATVSPAAPLRKRARRVMVLIGMISGF